MPIRVLPVAPLLLARPLLASAVATSPAWRRSFGTSICGRQSGAKSNSRSSDRPENSCNRSPMPLNCRDNSRHSSRQTQRRGPFLSPVRSMLIQLDGRTEICVDVNQTFHITGGQQQRSSTSCPAPTNKIHHWNAAPLRCRAGATFCLRCIRLMKPCKCLRCTRNDFLAALRICRRQSSVALLNYLRRALSAQLPHIDQCQTIRRRYSGTAQFAVTQRRPA